MNGVRPLGPGDRDLVLEWANDPETRANSFSSRPISPEEHAAWFARQLADRNVRAWILEVDGVPAALARYVSDGRVAEVSITVAPAHRGHGYGSTVLHLSADAAVRGLAVEVLVALILPGNTASIRSFERAGYSLVGEETRAGRPALRFERSLAT